jgi:hypothetical protein
MTAKQANDKNDYSPTLTYGDALEEIKAPEVKVEETEVKVKEPEVNIEKPEVIITEDGSEVELEESEPLVSPYGETGRTSVDEQQPFVYDPETYVDTTVLAPNDPNKIKTSLLDDRYGESITTEQFKEFREKRQAKEAEDARLAAEAAEAARVSKAKAAAAQAGRDQYIASMNSTYDVYKAAKKRGASSSELKTIESEGKKASSKMARYASTGQRPTGFKEGGLASKKKNKKKKK